MSSEEDRTRGAANSIGGKIKEGLGKLTGDKGLESEGHVDQAKGKAVHVVSCEGRKERRRGNDRGQAGA